MTGNIVARRYARALFSLAQGAGKKAINDYGKGLADLVAVINEAPELLRIFKNPLFSVDEKKALVSKIMQKTRPVPMVRDFCLLLADKDRLAYLPEIEAYYKKLQDEAEGIIRGEMVTAIKLPDKQKQELLKKLEKQSGRKIILDYSVDPDILGGLVLKVGDKVLDASIRAQIEILKENIKRGE